MTLVVDAFGVDSDALPATGGPLANVAAAMLQAIPGATALVEGFTDSVGAEACNEDLGRRRADAVLHAIAPAGDDRLHAVGRGEVGFVAPAVAP